ncbi:hypothetical protein Tdes44962_MAKER04215, partial [Teratosphaeria destructans]
QQEEEQEGRQCAAKDQLRATALFITTFVHFYRPPARRFTSIGLCSPKACRSWPVVSSLPIHSFDTSVTPSSRQRRRRRATMAASTTAIATMAAAGLDKRSSSTSTTSSSLQTPGSSTFPSELRTPMTASPGFVKQRESELKTPITPPSAYLDFLKQMSPAMLSPAPTTSASARFSFNEVPTSTSARFSFNADRTSDKASETLSEKPSVSPPTSQPALSRNTSYDSQSSFTSTSTDRSTASSSGTSKAGMARVRPESPRVTIPPSPFAKPALRSARTPKLRIPQSPFSAGPGSAQSLTSPYISTPLSAAPWSASYERNVDTELNGQPGKVSVRQVVTRTVTYCRTPLEAAPNGNLWKRRKIEHDDGKQDPVVEEIKTPPQEKALPAPSNIKEEQQDTVVPIQAPEVKPCPGATMQAELEAS